MREAKLKTRVTTLIRETCTGVDADVVDGIISAEDRLRGFLHRLNENGDSDEINMLWKNLATYLDEENKLDAIADGTFDNVGAYLSTLVGQV
jgi:RNA binding exosome subunit